MRPNSGVRMIVVNGAMDVNIPATSAGTLYFTSISRVANSKYVETTFGTFPLKWFFTHKATQNKEGDDVTARQVMAALRTLIEQEDKRQPLSDERLTQLLQADGFNIARRTVAKYREQMGIPVARMRK